MTNINLITLLSRLKGKPLYRAKEQTQAKVYKMERQERLQGGLQETVQFFLFFFTLFIVSEEAASSKSQTGFLSLPVVSDNSSILFPSVRCETPANELCDFWRGLSASSLN